MKIGDIKLPDCIEVNGKSLLLNGVGIRTKFFMNIYVAGLYLSIKNNNAKEIIESKQPMAIRMKIVYSLTGQQMSGAIIEGFEKATQGKTNPFDKELSMVISSLDKIKKGDDIEIAYVPDSEIVVHINSKEMGKVFNYEFKKALFAIWLGDNPVQKELKKALLG